MRSQSYQTDATASDDDVALDYLPRDDDTNAEITEGHREDAEADIEA